MTNLEPVSKEVNPQPVDKAQMDEVSDSALPMVVIDQPHRATQSMVFRTEYQSSLCDYQQKKEDHEYDGRAALQLVRARLYRLELLR